MALKLPERWVWDSWYVQHEGITHAFYLQADKALENPDLRHRHPSVGHATSTDLVEWTVLEDALVVSAPPAFDDSTTWTGSIVRDDDGLWWMFYTGTSHHEDSLVQRIGAATSNDLTRWTKVSDHALATADQEHYELLSPEIWHDQAWRDPWVFRFPGQSEWHMLITARANHGDPRERGVLGHATSTDLFHWSIEAPLSDPDQGFGQLEVFQFEVVDGVPLLVFSCAEAELGPERRARGEVGGVYSVVVDTELSQVDFTKAVLFDRTDIYAARLVPDPSGGWSLIGFINMIKGRFVGELSDPILVTASRASGLTVRSSAND